MVDGTCSSPFTAFLTRIGVKKVYGENQYKYIGQRRLLFEPSGETEKSSLRMSENGLFRYFHITKHM